MTAGSYRPGEDPAKWRGHAVLEIPVPQLESFVRSRTEFYDPAFLSADPRFCHAHITLLAPLFELPSEVRVQQVVSRLSCFDFQLAHMDVFPTGMIHLRPTPMEPFQHAVDALQKAFPEVTPYGGPHPVPHLSLDVLSDSVTLRSTRRLVGRLVPADCRAEHVDLCWYESQRCAVVERWTLR